MAFATGTLTASGAIADGETVTVGGKVYTFETGALDADGKVNVGVDDEESLLNLLKAINLSGVAGTDYAADMTANTQVRAVSSDATTVVVQALIEGTIGNQIASTETGTNLAWGAATLAGGTGDGLGDIVEIVRHAPSGIRQAVLDKIYGAAA